MIELFLIVAVVALIIHCYFVRKETKRHNKQVWQRIEKLEEELRDFLGVPK